MINKKKSLQQMVRSAESAEAKSKATADATLAAAGARSKQEIDSTVKKVADFLMSELDGRFGFKVEISKWSWVFGAMARILKKKGGEYVATVCVTHEYMSWRGSDESPEEQIQVLRIFMVRIVNGNDRMINVDSVEDFKSAMVTWLVNYRKNN